MSMRALLPLMLLALVTGLLLAACAETTGGHGRATPPPNPNAAEAPRVPPVFGYYEGEEVFFIHTEASDPEIAGILTGMMGSPVPVVPSLEEMPAEALSPVYVFTNGVKPQDTPLGPLNFQPDVFATAPSDDDYTPMRQVVEATWTDEDQARVLKSVADIEQAEADGQLTLQPTEVVIVAPLLTWPTGRR